MNSIMQSPLDRARAAVAVLPPSIAGQRGHAALFRAACTCVGYGLNEADALAVLTSEFNPRCLPPWGMADLRHKVADALKTVAPRSYSPRFMNDGPPPEARRARWPGFHAPNKAELRAIGELRNVSPEGLALAVQRGILWTAQVCGFACWLVTDSRRVAAQARRLDGKPFEFGDKPKAFTLPGSECAAPIGFDAVPNFCAVLFCEGGPDLLAAFHFIAIENRAGDCHAVAMLGASHNLAVQHAAAFAGRRVRFFPHLDEAGRNAVARWARALKPCAAKMDAVNFAPLRKVDGSQVADLNDCCFINPDDFETERILWQMAP